MGLSLEPRPSEGKVVSQKEHLFFLSRVTSACIGPGRLDMPRVSWNVLENVRVMVGIVKEKARLSPRSYEMIPPATRPSYSERTNVELVHSVGFHDFSIIKILR